MVASQQSLGGQGRGGAADQFFLHKSQDGTPYFSCSHLLRVKIMIIYIMINMSSLNYPSATMLIQL